MAFSAPDVQQRLAQAGDVHLSQVVALLDRMAVRGAADALLDPLRGRLAQLALVRPLTLSRLLFQPLDPVIEPGVRWRPGAAAVPRNALVPLGNAIIRLLGPCTAVRAAIEGRGWSDAAAVSAAGSVLWPAALDVLQTMPQPPGWGDAGLGSTSFEAVRDSVAAVLHHAGVLHRWPHETGRPELPGVVAAMLAETHAQRPRGLGTVLAVLLANADVAPGVLAVAATLPGTAPEAAVEQALARTERSLSISLPATTLPAACAQALQAASLLEAVDGPGAQIRFRALAQQAASLLEAVDGPGAQIRFRALAQQARRTADAACRGRMLQAVDQDVLPALAATSALDDAAATSLEAATRDIRRLSTVGQRLGSAPAYATLLNRIAVSILAAPGPALSPMDRLRLAELLVGADAALRLAG